MWPEIGRWACTTGGDPGSLHGACEREAGGSEEQMPSETLGPKGRETLLALKVEEEAISQGMRQPQKQRQGQTPQQSLQEPAGRHLDVSPPRLILAVWPQNSQIIKCVLFPATRLRQDTRVSPTALGGRRGELGKSDTGQCWSGVGLTAFVSDGHGGPPWGQGWPLIFQQTWMWELGRAGASAETPGPRHRERAALTAPLESPSRKGATQSHR